MEFIMVFYLPLHFISLVPDSVRSFLLIHLAMYFLLKHKKDASGLFKDPVHVS